LLCLPGQRTSHHSKGQQSQAQAQARGISAEPETANSTIKIRPATDIAQVSAAGNIALVDEQTLVMQAAGTVIEVTVEVGDEVYLQVISSDDVVQDYTKISEGPIRQIDPYFYDGEPMNAVWSGFKF